MKRVSVEEAQANVGVFFVAAVPDDPEANPIVQSLSRSDPPGTPAGTRSLDQAIDRARFIPGARVFQCVGWSPDKADPRIWRQDWVQVWPPRRS